MQYYLMEELPYIPSELYNLWFQTEKLMLRAAISEAKLLLDHFAT